MTTDNTGRAARRSRAFYIHSGARLTTSKVFWSFSLLLLLTISTEQSSLSMAEGWRVEDKKGILEVDKSNFSLKGYMPWNIENWVAPE
jgi:hypothetical protein